MSQDDKKARVAHAALEHLPRGRIIGIGTGSTANLFIDALARTRHGYDAAVASSEASAERLAAHGIEVVDLNDAEAPCVYVDGADEATRHRHLVKGGGGALTREKIVAGASKRFVCIVDDTKVVARLGAFGVPVEVIPMARSLVSRAMAALGGRPEWRAGFVTDNGNHVIDVHGLDVMDPPALEAEMDHIPGIVANGLFARRGADVLLVAHDEDVQVIE